jgi:hypothetical protein
VLDDVVAPKPVFDRLRYRRDESSTREETLFPIV